MEEFRKLGVMDFDEPMDSPNTYKNDLSLPLSTSSLESGYSSFSQSTSSQSSFDNSAEFDSLSLEGQSSKNDSTKDGRSLHRDNPQSNMKRSDSNDSDDNITTQSYGTGEGNSCGRKQPNGTESMEYSGSGDVQSERGITPKLMVKGPIQECYGEGNAPRNIHRIDSCDIIEEKCISIDETDRSICVREIGFSGYAQISRNTTQEGCTMSMPRCNCRHQILNASKLEMGKSDWVLLESQIDGHYIARSSPGFRQRFQLTSRDRLISVNEEDICHLSHNDVVRRMCDVIRMECKQSLAIERHRHTEDEEYIEIMRLDISLEFLDEDGGDTMVNFTARLLRKITRHFRVIYNLEWKNKLKCWISHFSEGKQKYLCSRDDSDELTLAHLPNIEDPRFQFSRDTYHGFRRDGCDNKGLYLVTLMCKATDGYISVGTSGGVKLKRYVNDTKGMTSVSHPLPQMFICRMYKDGKYNLESLNHEGCLLRWSTRKKMIEIKEVDDDEYNGRNRPEFLFSIYTDASKVV